jgi:GT2 family glycosyltransferase
MLNASIVIFKNSFSEIASLVEILRKSVVVSDVFLLDNSPVPTPEFESLPVKYIFNSKNLGYGAAHNIALRQSIEKNTPYHLIVNPDISFHPEIIEKMIGFMNNNSEIGHLMPKVYYPDGKIQYLCKLIPTPSDLLFRRFLPKSRIQKRTERFELRTSGTLNYGCAVFVRLFYAFTNRSTERCRIV